MATITSSRTEMFVPSSTSTRTRPWKARNAARVTTNDGMPTLATSEPSTVPMITPVRMAAATQTYQGRPALARVTASTAAQTPLAKPADRSISPSSSTNTRPMAMSVTAAPCVNRLAKLIAVTKEGRAAAKTAQSTTRPSTAGSAPMSPPRTRWM